MTLLPLKAVLQGELAPAVKFAFPFEKLDALPKPDAGASFFVLVDEDHTGVLESPTDISERSIKGAACTTSAVSRP
jgi:hypothetical protein